MRILFCDKGKPTIGMGASKVILELADALNLLGDECSVIGSDEIIGVPNATSNVEVFIPALREFLRRNAHRWDVIEYNHEELPYPRTDFASDVLMVARSVLLVHHLERIKLPDRPGLKYAVRKVIYSARDRKRVEGRIRRAGLTIESADLINVSNRHDRIELLGRGVPDEKIITLPYGMSETRRQLFNQVSDVIPSGPPTIAFVGTFDYRKGAREIPEIWKRVKAAVPQARLRLLGTAGLMQSEAEVRACFSSGANESIEVYPRFDPKLLPQLLNDCSVGMFPSWLEGFGFGVLEMLAAAIPVVAYDAPGPPEMLGPEDLVAPGNINALADRLIHWLTHPHELQRARTEARDRSRVFNWKSIAEQTRKAYEKSLQSLRHSARKG